jgi:peptidyl-tRNA hydrolase, PTH1 family
MYIVVGLGNKGEEYEHTRHNVGRMALVEVEKYLGEKEVKGVKVAHFDTFMNLSGGAVLKLVKTPSTARKLIVIYDDLDLPLGSLKISYDRGSGGHKGIESIIKSLKTREFIRIRIGISPVTPSGKIKKLLGEDVVGKHILGVFKKSEEEVLKKVFKRTAEAVERIVESDLQTAMTEFNK